MTKICYYCGSSEGLYRDAWVSVNDPENVITFDSVNCEVCDGSTSLMDEADLPAVKGEELPENALTLSRHPDSNLFLPLWDRTRSLVRFAGDVPTLTMEWQKAELVGGHVVEVRRAPCGAGCYCGGEYK